ncbi:MAG: hypothetical protein AB7H90_01205 [Alphaproteobacteria bacterium]
MSDRAFTNPDFGKEVRIEQVGREVHLIFVAGNQYKANKLVENLLAQLKAGALNITLMGKPTSITEER